MRVIVLNNHQLRACGGGARDLQNQVLPERGNFEGNDFGFKGVNFIKLWYFHARSLGIES